MNIILERTRIIFQDYSNDEELQIDELVATMDNIFSYKDKDNRRICLPTGMLDPVKKLFSKYHIDDKSNTYWDYNNIEPVEHTAQPRNQLQIDFIKFVLEQVNKKQKLAGILGVGTGKTFMACYSSIKAGLKTLFIAPTRGIKDQWVDTLINMFKVDSSRVTSIDSPKDFINTNSDFVVTTQASLAILNKKYDLEKVMKANRFGIKVIDEVQMWFKNIINIDGCSNICNNWYLTGTFGRSAEDENDLFQQMFGDLAIFTEKEKKPTLFNPRPGNIYGMKPHTHVKIIWTKSGLSESQISDISTSKRYSEREGKWIRYGISIPKYTNLIIPEDGHKTKFIQKIMKTIKMANDEVKYGRMLILTSTISSTEVLAKYIREAYPDLKIGTIHSRNKKELNDDVKLNYDIIISTSKTAGTGFDVKDLSKLIIVEAMKSWILGLQTAGRLRRRSDNKDTYLYKIVDSSVPQLSRWGKIMSDVLKRIAKTFKVIDL